MTPAHRARGDQGGGVVQLPLMATVLIGFLMLIVFVGRVNNAYSAAESAARYSARQMTLARDPTAAANAAEKEAQRTVSQNSPGCGPIEFSHQIEPDRVVVTVTCDLALAGSGVFGIPGHWQVTATAEEPIDQWREQP